ncbi:EamA family transporter [Desulfovibrio aminophilus]|uniref:DMT family transporter n=1 Tax=Desulfovibrio aminophilus TaxID=81425 RepID=UPI003392ADCE
MIRGMLYSVISAICYGMMAIMAKLGFAAGMDTWGMLQHRFAFGALILAVVLLIRNPAALRPSPRLLAKAALLGCVFYVFQSVLFFMALERIPASTTALVFYFYPVAVTLLSALIFRLRIDRYVVASLTLVMLGCALVFYDAFLKGLSGAGVFYALASMVLFSAYLIAVQLLLRNEEPLQATFFVVLFAALAFTVINGPGTIFQLNTIERLGIGLSLGIVPTALAISLLYLAIEKIGSAWTSIFSTFEPVATLAAAGLILGEQVVALQLFGVAFIVAGIVLPNARMLTARKTMGTKAA